MRTAAGADERARIRIVRFSSHFAHLDHGGRLAHGPKPPPCRRPGLQCALSRLTVSASHSLLRSSALHSMAVTIINSRAKSSSHPFSSHVVVCMMYVGS